MPQGSEALGRETAQQKGPAQHCLQPVDSITIDPAHPAQEMEAQGATRIGTHLGHLSLSPTSPAMDETPAQSPRSSLSATSCGIPNNQPMDVTDTMSLTSADSSSSALPDTAYCGKPLSKQASPARILTARKFARLAALRERAKDCSDESELEKQKSESENDSSSEDEVATTQPLTSPPGLPRYATQENRSQVSGVQMAKRGRTWQISESRKT